MYRNVLLVFPLPPSMRALSHWQPIGISYIASYVLEKSPQINIKIVDFTVDDFSPEGWKKELQDFAPELVGISLMTINSSHGKHIAQLTKEFDPNILVVMGGPHAMVRTEECLQHCDIVVQGEGEESFHEIICGHDWMTINGISFRKEGEIIYNKPRERIKNLDDLPFPAHHLFKMEKYNNFKGWGIIGSRGCPYECIYCCSPQMWGRLMRFRSAANIVDEIEYLYNKFDIKNITFFDDTINVPQQRSFDICNEIISRDLHKKVSFVCQLKANKQLVSMELFLKMKEANFIEIDFGIESGSQKVLDSIKKSLTIDDAKQAVTLAKKAGIKKVVGFFMVGNWDETFWDVCKTWCFIFTNYMAFYPSFSITTPYPGTELFSRLTENDYINTTIDWDIFDRKVPAVRSNRMSKMSMFLLFSISGFFSLIRQGRVTNILRSIVVYPLQITRVWLKQVVKK